MKILLILLLPLVASASIEVKSFKEVMKKTSQDRTFKKIKIDKGSFKFKKLVCGRPYTYKDGHGDQDDLIVEINKDKIKAIRCLSEGAEAQCFKFEGNNSKGEFKILKLTAEDIKKKKYLTQGVLVLRVEKSEKPYIQTVGYYLKTKKEAEKYIYTTDKEFGHKVHTDTVYEYIGGENLLFFEKQCTKS